MENKNIYKDWRYLVGFTHGLLGAIILVYVVLPLIGDLYYLFP